MAITFIAISKKKVQSGIQSGSKTNKNTTMSKLILSLFLLIITSASGQTEYEISSSSNDDLIKILNNSELISQNTEDYLSVRIYKFSYPEGSAPDSCCEIIHDLYVAISATDETPEQNLFIISSIFNPKFIKWSKIEEYSRSFQIEYGGTDKRKILNLKVDLKGLNIE